MNEHIQPVATERAERSDKTGAEPPEVANARAAAVRALTDLENAKPHAMEGLQQTLCRLVAALRRAGSSRDEVITAVRALVSNPATPEGADKIPRLAREALVDLTIRWCEDEFARPE